VGELSQHAESNNRSLLYLLIRESPPESEQILGVGGAIIFNGSLWHGTNFFAGEVSDTLNSLFLTGMIKKWRDKMSRTHEMKKRTLGYLLESAANNNPDSRAAADEIASNLGKFMSEVVSFLDPGCVMIYINPSHDGYDMAARIEEYFYKHIPAGFGTTRFLEPRLKERAIIRGLISLTQEKIFVRDGIHSSLLFK
jgi:predicted NBD/HSP70 family sugar kinase